MRSLHSTFKRKPRRKVVSRSFRIPPDVDRALARAARERRWSKSLLIRDIIQGWLTYQAEKAAGE